MSIDVKYEFDSYNNKKIERNEKIIIFGNKERLSLMKNKEYIEYFMDIMFKIIPKSFRPYKLLTLASLDNRNKKSIVIGFVLFIFMDSISFLKIFEYLNNNFKFSPLIIHSDYEKGIALALQKAKFFENNVIHVKCFFHFVKSIREKLKKTCNNGKYITKNNFVILKNIELLCFINGNRINGYKSFILDKLKEYKINKSFIDYLNKLYLTNNIIECLNSKINKFTGKYIPSKINFISSMKNIILNDTIKYDNYKRYDHISKSLILLIEKENLNNDYKWISYDTFKN